MSRLTRWVAAATLAGLLAALWVIGRVGLAQVTAAVAGIGIVGFALFVASHGVVLWVLGVAWAWSAPERLSPVRLFAWGRTVREAANELLPFSQLGGLVLGLRVVLAAGLPPVPVYAATVIDSVTEIASQILYVLFGLGIVVLLLGHHSGEAIVGAAWGGVALLTVLTAGFVLLQRPALRLAAKGAARFVPQAAERFGAVEAELARFNRRPAALLPSFLANLAAWLLSAASSWLALWLLGHPVAPWNVAAMEAMISVVRSGAFLIPGALGAQELGYAALGPLVGLPAEAALALSLLKRARDVVLGVPVLLIWQATEARRRPARP